MIEGTGIIQRLFGRAEPPIAVSGPAADKPAQPPTLGQFGEQGEQVGEHITHFLSRLDEVYSLRQAFAAVAEPMQDFIRSHGEAQTRLAETNALLSRERTEAQALRAELLTLRADHGKLEGAFAEASTQLQAQTNAANERGEQLGRLRIAHDDATSRLDWTTRQHAKQTQNGEELANTHRGLAEDFGRLEQELALERARSAELKDQHEAASAEAQRLHGQIERLQPTLSAARRRIGELETDLGNAATTLGATELKLVSEQEIRRTTEAARTQDKACFESELSGLTLQIESLEGRHGVTTKLLDQTRALLNEKSEEARLLDRSARDATAERAALERRHASAQDEIRRLLEQNATTTARHGELQERCSMLTNALAAKDAHIEQVEARGDALKGQIEDATSRHEQQRSSLEDAHRKLIEEVQSERAERALAQGALTIARNSREKLVLQLEELKRERFGRPSEAAVAEPRDTTRETTNVTPFRPTELTTD